MGGAPIKPLPVSAAQDRSLVAFADREVNGPRRPWRERDRGRLVALANDVQRSMAAMEAEVLDVAGAGFGHAKAV
jgi:hypothetical protein